MNRKIILFTFILLITIFKVEAQCPSGTINSSIWGTPDDFAFGFTADNDINDEDTVQVVQGEDTTIYIQYLLPKKQAITSPISGNATVTSVQIIGVTGLPTGMNWTLDVDANAANNTYYPQTYRYGTVTLCGSTFSTPGVKTLTVSVNGCGSLSGISDCAPASFPLYIEVLAGSGGNSGFTFSPPIGCNSLDVDFEAIFQSSDPILYPVDFTWDFGDGSTGSGATVLGHNYTGANDYAVEMNANINEYYISYVGLSSITGAGFADIPDCYGVFNGTNLSEQSNDNTPSWNVDIPLSSNVLTCDFYDADLPPLNSDDHLGSWSYTINTNNLFDGYQLSYVASQYTVTCIIHKRIASVVPFNDTVHIYNNSTGTITSSNGILFCGNDSTILDLGTSSTYDFIQWYNDTTLLLGENAQTLTVKTSGNYYAEVLNTGNVCSGNSNIIDITVENVLVPSIAQTSTGISISNPNSYDVQWYSNGVPIPGATANELTDLSNGNPFTVSFTNTNGCEAFSDEFNAIIQSAGTSTNNGTTLSTSDNIVFTSTGFNLCPGQAVAWAVSTEEDGPITSMAELQNSIDNGWVYPSTDLNTFDAGCGNTEFPPGDYYMTPVSVDAPNIEPVYWNSNTDSFYCDAKMELCIELTGGADWKVDPLTVQLPNGNTIDIMGALANLAGTPITPALWDIATSQFGDPLCIDFIDILGYYDNPNGTWTISVNNTGTDGLDFNISNFDIVVKASTCDSLATDQIIPMEGIGGHVAAGETGVYSFVVPPIPSNFPEVTSSCLLFGGATQFTSSCPLGIEDLIDIENIYLYPNPNNGLFNLEFEVKERSEVNISIMDITGRTVLQNSYPNAYGNFKEQYDLKNNLNAGFYFIDIQVGTEHTQKKFIVK